MRVIAVCGLLMITFLVEVDEQCTEGQQADKLVRGEWQVLGEETGSQGISRRADRPKQRPRASVKQTMHYTMRQTAPTGCWLLGREVMVAP